MPGADAPPLQRCTVCNTSLPAKSKNGNRGLARGLTKGFWPLPLSLAKFCDPSTSSLRKVDNGEKKGGDRKKEIILEIVAPNDINS